ncbi:hypothetical protein ACFQS7_29480, partial [Dankookia sp. GCM10030260]
AFWAPAGAPTGLSLWFWSIGLTSGCGDLSTAVGCLIEPCRTPDGAYDQEGVSTAVAERHQEALVIVPPHSTAVPSEMAASAPTQRDRHLQCMAEHGRAAWQKTSGYNTGARVEATIGRFKQVIGYGLRSRTDQCRATEMARRTLLDCQSRRKRTAPMSTAQRARFIVKISTLLPIGLVSALSLVTGFQTLSKEIFFGIGLADLLTWLVEVRCD